ncbi:helix-turn-helix domain-containing protein [bacterium]|nr:helix-turn-helix domain-containing protein [bacterium]
MRWQDLNKEWLREEYVSKHRSLSEMAREAGCNRHTIKKALKHLGVPIRPKEKNVDPEYARKLYQQGVPVTEIAKMFGCGRETVYKKLRASGSTVVKRVNLNREKLKDMYLVQQLSTNEIAKRVGCDPSSVTYALHKYGIPSRTVTEGIRLRGAKIHPELYDEKWLRQKYIEEGLSMERIAQLIGTTSSVVHLALRRCGIPSHPVRFRSKGPRRTTLPTFPERVFITMCDKYNLPFKYVGNGAFWIGNETEHLNPDFIATNNTKVVIEIFGDFWDSPLFNRKIKRNHVLTYRKAFYKKWKWKCVFIWESDLLREDAEQFVLELLKRELGESFAPKK